MVSNSRRKRRILANGVIAIAIAAATSVGVALAGGGGNTPPPPTVANAADDVKSGLDGGASTQPSPAVPKAAADVGFNEDFHAALQALVDDGTITQTQANIIREQGDNGTIDPRALVRDGVVSAAVMRRVTNRLDNVKSRLDPGTSTTPTPAQPKG